MDPTRHDQVPESGTPDSLDAHLERRATQMVASLGRAYLLLTTIARIIPEERRPGMHLEELRELAGGLRRQFWEETPYEARLEGMSSAISTFISRIEMPRKSLNDVSWKTLRVGLAFEPTPPILFSAPVGPMHPIPPEAHPFIEEILREARSLLEELLREVKDPALRAQIQSLLDRIGTVTAGGTAAVVAFLESIGALMLRVKAVLPTARFIELIHKLKNLAMVARNLSALGFICVDALVTLWWILIALGVGLAIGYAINNIDAGGGKNVSDSLGELLYHTFLESEADVLLAAQDALIGELGEYADQLKNGQPLTSEQVGAAIALASALIANCQKKLAIGAEPRKVVVHRMRWASQLLQQLLALPH